MAAKGSKGEDWFDNLDKELDKKTQQAQKSSGVETSQKGDLNKTFISDFWRILLRFEKIHVHFTIEPAHTLFATFEKYPHEWALKENFDYGGVNQIVLVDRTREQNRAGDTLKLRYYAGEEGQNIRLSFEYCEGEHYYKYSGWRRIFSQFVLLDVPVKKLDMDQFHTVMGEVVRQWYDSHLKHDRNMLISYMTSTFEKGESYTL